MTDTRLVARGEVSKLNDKVVTPIKKPVSFSSVESLDKNLIDSKYSPLDGFVYVVEYGNGRVKIGQSIHVKQRMKQLSSMASRYFDTKLGRVAVTPPFPHYKELEETLHNYFADERVPDTELFDVSILDVMDVMDRIDFDQYNDEYYNALELYSKAQTNRLRLALCKLPDTSPDFVLSTLASVSNMTKNQLESKLTN